MEIDVLLGSLRSLIKSQPDGWQEEALHEIDLHTKRDEQPVGLSAFNDTALNAAYEVANRHGIKELAVAKIVEAYIDNLPKREYVNPDPIFCDHIFATDGSLILIDPEDYPILSRHNWYINMSGTKKYAVTKLKTDQTTIWRAIFIQHMILGTSTTVDHIDGNPLNNRKENLRKATVQENGWNTRKRMVTCTGNPPTSLYKGVRREVRSDGTPYWRVTIKITKKHEKPAKHVRLGPFATEVEAAKAYNEEIVKHRGKFAYLNTIPTDIEVGK